MANLSGVVRQWKAAQDRAAREAKRLDAALAALNGPHGKLRETLSASAGARIAAAQPARWARVRASKNGTAAPERTMSARPELAEL